MDKIQQLENRITELEKQIQLLQNSNTIPTNIDKSFMGRGFLKTTKPEIPDGSDTNAGFVVGINAAIPFTYLRVLNIEGQNFWVPLYTYIELG